MCGRFTHLYTWKQLHRLLALTSPEIQLPISFNVAPTQNVPIILPAAGLTPGTPHAATLRMLRWGLVPFWAKDIAIGSTLINARSEGIESKPSYRNAFSKGRCLVPISGFYEWKEIDEHTPKQPWYIHPKAAAEPRGGSSADGAGSGIWLLAGVSERWHDPKLEKDAPPLETFSIITTSSNVPMAPIHHRMPVILEPEQAQTWLNPETPPEDALALLKPPPGDDMASHPVATFVNSPRNNTPRCIEAAEQMPSNSLFG